MTPCPPDRLDRLVELGMPPEAIQMYRDCSLRRQVNGQVVLLAASSLLAETKESYPGISVYPHGYVAFARTDCGDIYAFDANSVDAEGRAAIVIFPGDFYDDPITADRADMISKRVAGSLMEFLEKYADNKVDETPKHF